MEAHARVLDRFERDAGPRIQLPSKLITDRFPQDPKNSSGYALDPTSLRTTAWSDYRGRHARIVTEIEWRLDDVPAYRAGSGAPVLAPRHWGTWSCCPEPMRAIRLELFDRSFLDLLGAERLSEAGLGSDTEAIVLVELERNDPGSLHQALRRASEGVARWASTIETAYSPPEAEQLWAIRHAASPILAGLPENRRSLQVIEDGCVPVGSLGEYIAAVRRSAARHDLPVVMFGHAGDGHLHVNLLPELRARG